MFIPSVSHVQPRSRSLGALSRSPAPSHAFHFYIAFFSTEPNMMLSCGKISPEHFKYCVPSGIFTPVFSFSRSCSRSPSLPYHPVVFFVLSLWAPRPLSPTLESRYQEVCSSLRLLPAPQPRLRRPEHHATVQQPLSEGLREDSQNLVTISSKVSYNSTSTDAVGPSFLFRKFG